jgi:hypothetical protein
MADGSMAIGTFNLTVRDMLLMHHLGGIFRGQDFRLRMTLDTFPFGDMGIPLNHTLMALFTGHSPGDILLVIKTPPLHLDVPFGFDVAGGATPNRAGDAVLLPFGTSLEIVADKTVRFMDREVLSLNDLGVARGAPKLHSSSQLSQVFPVREGHVFIDHIFLKVLDLMTSRLEAACITDLGMGLAGSLSGNEIG